MLQVIKNTLPFKIKNFAIIAHIDHGKSTLSDSLLKLTGCLPNDAKKQYLDKLLVEQQRGITVKAQSAAMIHNGYLLNLIDTPGHVDFNYEVRKSLESCDGVILVVDAVKGIQAQTVANFRLLTHHTVIPVVNKIDNLLADPDKVALSIVDMFNLPLEDIIYTSAKNGTHVDKVLNAIINKIPPPKAKRSDPTSIMLMDSWFDQYNGVVCLVNIRGGYIKEGMIVESCAFKKQYEIRQIGVFSPEEIRVGELHAGQVGYIIPNMRDIREAKVGDTFYQAGFPVKALPGFQPLMPMVFCGCYPIDNNDYKKLDESISKLKLNDSSVAVQKESSGSLGQGFRLGFLGSLHMEIFVSRLKDEFNVHSICTTPNVSYKIINKDSSFRMIDSPMEFPESNSLLNVSSVQEPIANAEIITPVEYEGQIVELIFNRRGILNKSDYMDNQVVIQCTLPLAEIALDFHDRLKSYSSGYASLTYDDAGYVDSDMVKLNILLNGKPADTLSCVIHRTTVEYSARVITKKLKDLLDRQQFEIIIQAAIGKKILAREKINAYRKDVTAKIKSGSDQTRKMKLLERQKEGKKKLKSIGQVKISQKVFMELMKKD
eukprot:NODE_132_length_18298_cov_0.443101.p1 type:complete len:600 gc:universal NODE_132_length_18298_cov_0.443101:16931-15132(-)